MLVDSHCHLDQLDVTQLSLAQQLEFARSQGVGYFLCVCIDKDNMAATLAVAEQYSDVSASIGIHPSDPNSTELSVEQLVDCAQHPKVVAIGETGLDYSRLQGDPTWQQERFRRHIRAGIQAKKPLIVHTRDARVDTIRLLREEKADLIGGVLHCFTEDLTMAQQAMDLGFYISFSGIITFKNAQALQSVVQHIPLDKILIETDAPYLAPVPFRGKSNQPAWVKYVAEKVAELKCCTFSEVARQTTLNFERLFNLAVR